MQKGVQLTAATWIGCGLWTPVQAMPKVMQDIAAWMPAYSFANGPWQIIAGHEIEWKSAGILGAYLAIFMVLSSYIVEKQGWIKT